jgi:L-ribulose-5-phosphate 3-epimerase
LLRRVPLGGGLVDSLPDGRGGLRKGVMVARTDRERTMTQETCGPVSRRGLLRTVMGAGAAGTLATVMSPLAQTSWAASDVSDALAGRMLKTLKIGMVKAPGASLADRFRIAKAAGFDGMEMGFPGGNVAETKAAITESGLPVDGSVCGEHWEVRHTSADADTRARALGNLQQALRDTHAVGGHSVLVVVGKGEDGPEQEIWARSIDNISQAVPLAAELGVQILVENVWNQFLYDHEGGSEQTAEKFVRYIDDFDSPWVGMQFDIGNHWKYGAMGDWIRALDHRIRKLDVKGFSRQENAFKPIGDGDIDFADVRKALREINFHGWVAAEVAGGDEAQLRRVAEQMDAAFGL